MSHRSTFRRIARDVSLRITDRGYRHQQAELARLRSLPRYKTTTTSLIGIPLEIVDAPSFLAMHQEIYEQQAYRFRAKMEEPFIVDGGANIGLTILYFKELYPRSEIIGFEPDEKIFPVLERNIQRSGYGNIKLLRQALWTAQTTLGFISEGSWAGRLARAEEHPGQVVRTARLRDYLNRAVDFLKLRNGPGIREIRRNRVKRKGVQSPPVQIIPMTEVAILEEDFPAFSDILEIPFCLGIPGVGVGLHQPTHALLNNLSIRVFLVIFSLRIHPIGILGSLQDEGFPMHFGARGRCRVDCP